MRRIKHRSAQKVKAVKWLANHKTIWHNRHYSVYGPHWCEIARALKHVGLYSSKTSLCDIRVNYLVDSAKYYLHKRGL